jgi:NAD(P)-dependent dehydrogenase (short-subunit alcohol dehydrogenase family)
MTSSFPFRRAAAGLPRRPRGLVVIDGGLPVTVRSPVPQIGHSGPTLAFKPVGPMRQYSMMSNQPAGVAQGAISRHDEPWRLDGRVALVTGASAGLGGRFARVLHAAGAFVVATARRAERLDELASDCGERMETLPGDITTIDHRHALIERLHSLGRLDVLVNNAGICDDGPIEEQTLDDLLRVIDVNLISVLDTCRLAAPLLLAAPNASVINVASIYGIVASPSPMAAYNATKGAVINLTRQLAAQWGERGVRVNALAPGYFPTELTGFLADPGFERAVREHTLLGRTPRLDEIDGPLLFLASAASSYMTGQVLVIDGGWTAV